MKKEILLSYFPKATVKRYQQLIAVFDNLNNAWQADSEALKTTGWDEKVIQEFLTWKEKINEEKIAKILDQENIYCTSRNFMVLNISRSLSLQTGIINGDNEHGTARI